MKRGTGRSLLCIAVTVAAAAVMLGNESAAQANRASRQHAAAAKPHTTTNDVPNPLQGFSKNRDEPIHIDAAALEVRDKDQMATFTGDVHVVQGDTDLRCDKLVVYYEQQKGGKTAATGATGSATARARSADGKASPASASLGSGSQRIRRLEVTGNVVVTQKDQTATGDSGNFDMRTNTITLVGNVIVSHGQNVLRGDRLMVDMGSGTSRMESNSGRVQGLFLPSQKDSGPNAGGLGSVH